MAFSLARDFLRCIGIGSVMVAAAQVDSASAAEGEGLLSDGLVDPQAQLATVPPQPVQAVAVQSIPRVYVARAIGRVTIGETGESPGKKRFGARSQVAGSGTSVSFSTAPVRDQLASAAVGAGQLPLETARLTSGFGVRRISADGGTRSHAGVDLAAPAGTPIAAAFDGHVTVADWNGSYGLLVVIEHGNGMQTRYAHLSRLGVSEGQLVRQGQVLGFVGSTGRSTGPHLHYELRQNGRPVNPLAH